MGLSQQHADFSPAKIIMNIIIMVLYPEAQIIPFNTNDFFFILLWFTNHYTFVLSNRYISQTSAFFHHCVPSSPTYSTHCLHATIHTTHKHSLPPFLWSCKILMVVCFLYTVSVRASGGSLQSHHHRSGCSSGEQQSFSEMLQRIHTIDKMMPPV